MKGKYVSSRPDIKRLFSKIAGRYDIANSILSFNQDARWRKRGIELSESKPGQVWLDVCCGTGKLTFGLRRRNELARLVGLDFTPAMLDVARKNELKEFGTASIEWIEADALNMPFADRLFDGVIIGCGLRNFPDFDAGLTEMARVLRPGGRIVCLELALPQQKIWRQIHRFYLRTLFSAAGNLGLGPEKNYEWVLDSLDRFPPPAELVVRFEMAGFCQVGFEQFLGGLATIHFAMKGES